MTPSPDDDGETSLPEEPAEPAEAAPEPEPSPAPEPVPAYLRLLMETDWTQFCQELEAFRQAAAVLMTNGTAMRVQPSQVVLLNAGTMCSEAADEARAEETTTTEMPSAGLSPNPLANMISIQMYIADAAQHFSRNLTEDFLRFWGCRGLEYPIRKVDLVLQPLAGADGGAAGQGSGAGVIAAIAISCVAAACLLVLAALLLVMRKRQKSLSYGQRCTPVSLDAYSLDSVSVCNSSSVRRKGAGPRASKRSYGNPAFSDPAAPSHPLTFPALSNMSGDRPAVESEFTAIPQVAPKADELPAGADTKNRYANVIPLPETRVTLNCKDGDPLSQYINANYVRGPKNTDKFYIACQAPLASTVHDFWRMVWETQSKVIIMLTDLVEDGVEKCAEYLPPSEVTDCHRLFGDFQVTLKKREVKDKYIVSSIQLKNMETNLWREATHMWYMGWPSRGVPEDPSTIIAFLIEARAFMRSPSSAASAGSGAPGAPGARQSARTSPTPSVVHCSPGTGRTGTVLAIDLCIREFETTRQVDIPRTVYRLRKDRAGCVQTKEQYMFIYKALNLYATRLTGGALDSI